MNGVASRQAADGGLQNVTQAVQHSGVLSWDSALQQLQDRRHNPEL
uniref:Uncharacterized protein n=1 Tax=Phenylobacterium glaciei TaxID=2803784 RepID=A0A974SAA9_9CAUL|nr:hypothetical protein JKL49_02350 [Phenylobacterium glaciei]